MMAIMYIGAPSRDRVPALMSSVAWADKASPVDLWRNVDEYTGGQILDPDNGKLYGRKINLAHGVKKLNVRRYIGVPTIGRSQIWSPKRSLEELGPASKPLQGECLPNRLSLMHQKWRDHQ